LEGFLEISRQSFPWYPKFGDLSRQKILWWLMTCRFCLLC
jgi:hypothetical protein